MYSAAATLMQLSDCRQQYKFVV